MSLRENLEKLLTSLEKELEENARDIAKLEVRYNELLRERIRLIDGIEGIKDELRRLEDEGIGD